LSSIETWCEGIKETKRQKGRYQMDQLDSNSSNAFPRISDGGSLAGIASAPARVWIFFSEGLSRKERNRGQVGGLRRVGPLVLDGIVYHWRCRGSGGS
jgi:hypothetical protein